MIKKVVALVVLVVVASLSVAGCQNYTSPSPTPTPTASSGTANAFLERFANQYKNDRLNGDQGGITHHTIDITEPRNDSVSIDERWVDQDGVSCGHHIIVSDCGSVSDATYRFTLMTAGQDLKDDGHGFLWGADTYNEVTGHAPQVEYMLSNESYVYLQYDQYYLGLTMMCPAPADLQQPGKIPAATSATPTLVASTPTTDYSRYFDTWFGSGNAIMMRPFTKSTNERGNDFYTGVMRNSSLSERYAVTVVVELTKSKDQAKLLYDQTVAQKQNEGFVARPDWIAQVKGEFPYLAEDWEGQQYSSEQTISVSYHYDSYPSSWLFCTQAGSQ
jgi:hypothetical protein